MVREAAVGGMEDSCHKTEGKYFQNSGQSLREKGAEVLELPSISISPLEDQSRLQEAFAKLNTYDWLVFTSPAGVEVFWRELGKKKVDIRCLGSVKIAAIGEGTKKKLLERGIYADFVPSVYDG